MILFAVSFILVFITSYFISSLLAKGQGIKGCVYILLSAFCQIIVISELLSTFYKITELSFLTLNLLFTVISLVLWLKADKPVFKICLKEFLRKIFNSCRLDKCLMILLFGWVIFILVSIFLIILLPTTSGDGFSYHVVRSYDWVINQSLAHYETADVRCNSFPINSELLYMWVILFTKRQICLSAFTFVGYILFLLSSFQIFKYIGYSMRRTLWTLLIVSSFASVIVMVSGTETDLIIAGLITASIYLFVDAIKNKSDNTTLFMSSLAYALAIGVKAPAIICIPAVALLYIIISIKHHDKYSLLKFIGFGIINFILFSSYNYILNFFDYGNMMGHSGTIVVHKNLWGVKGTFATFIKHLFLLVDFSGIIIPPKLGQFLFDTERNVIQLLNLSEIPNGIFSGTFYFNISLTEPGMGCGILSFLLVFPCWLISLFRPIFDKKRIVKIQGIFSLMFLINIIVLSVLIAFMTFNTRFLTAFIMISAPMLACSYFKSKKNIIKILLVLIAMLYFTVISTHLWGRPFFRLIKVLKNTSVVQLRSDIHCGRYDRRQKGLEEWCNIEALFTSKFDDKKYKVLVMPNFSELILYAKIKQLQGYNYSFINAEHLKNIDVDKYDIIIIPQGGQIVTSFDKYTPDKIDYFLGKTGNDKEPMYYPLNEESEVLCYYNSILGTLSKEVGTENDTPIVKSCTLSSKFYEHHPFEIAFKTSKYYILLNIKTFPQFSTK